MRWSALGQLEGADFENRCYTGIYGGHLPPTELTVNNFPFNREFTARHCQKNEEQISSKE